MTNAPPRVVVAEDNVTNRYVICAMLRGLGIEPSVAKDGEEAVFVTLSEIPKLVLMDINMPKLNGMDAANKILATPGFELVPIVAVTANATKQQELDCLGAGFSGFITKPIDADVFEDSIKQYLDMSFID